MPEAKSPTPCHTSKSQFVDSRVLTNPTTAAILDRITPYFPKTSKVISGFLRPDDLYWKVNYHWDVLLEAIDHCSELEIEEKQKKQLARLRSDLLSNSPQPSSGYRKSQKVGEPKDRSTHDKILARHATLAQAKKDFKALVAAAKVFEKTKRSKKALELAYAPVARPEMSKHGTGYALDIAGDNDEIKEAARSLGASLVFDEGSHVHCEWRNGVKRPSR